jgi:hypothetical protein
MKALARRDAEGTLSAEERAEFVSMQEQDARFQALGVQDRTQKASRKERSRESKRRLLVEFPNLIAEPGTTAEYRRHAERVARLERAKAVAAAAQIPNASARIEQLLDREQRRHLAWLARHKGNANGTSAGARP